MKHRRILNHVVECELLYPVNGLALHRVIDLNLEGRLFIQRTERSPTTFNVHSNRIRFSFAEGCGDSDGGWLIGSQIGSQSFLSLRSHGHVDLVHYQRVKQKRLLVGSLNVSFVNSYSRLRCLR